MESKNEDEFVRTLATLAEVTTVTLKKVTDILNPEHQV